MSDVTVDESIKNFEYGEFICEVKFSQVDGKFKITGTAVSTDESNGHRFPWDVLLAGAKTLIGRPIVDWHGDYPKQEVKFSDYIGKVTGIVTNEETKELEFNGHVFDSDAQKVIANFPEKIRFSVGFRHNYERDEKGIRVSKSVAFDHLGMLSDPADDKAILKNAQDAYGDGWNFRAEGKSLFRSRKTPTDTDATSGSETMDKEPADKKDPKDNAPAPDADGKKPDTEPKPDQKVADKEAAKKPADDKQEESKKDSPQDAVDRMIAATKAQVAAEAETKALRTELAEFKARFEATEAANKKADIVSYVDALVKGEIIVAGAKDGTVEHLLTLDEKQLAAQKVLYEMARKESIYTESGLAPAPEAKGTDEERDRTYISPEAYRGVMS